MDTHQPQGKRHPGEIGGDMVTPRYDDTHYSESCQAPITSFLIIPVSHPWRWWS
jgi:hypothetical protein